MRPGRDGLSEFSKENVHRGGIEPGHHQGYTGVACRAYGADDPCRLVANIAAQPARGIAALPPDIAGPALLSNPRLALAPDFKPLGFRMSLHDFRQAASKPLFFEGLLGLLAALRVARSGLPVRQVERPQHSQHPGLAVAAAPALLHQLAQIDDPPPRD